jgi:predicted GNAT superfamily acetyltransferase
MLRSEAGPGPLTKDEGRMTKDVQHLSFASRRLSGITIRPVKTIVEFHAVEDIQRRAWAMSHDLEVVPLHLLVTAAKNGGMLLGAFDGEEMVGFVFGFIGLTAEGKVKHCSHMMGVLPGVQSRGIGYQLKLAQRDFVLAQGLDLVTWTYDPLESRNAYLNVAKLGAVSHTYLRDVYGVMADGLSAGVPSDRLEMEWWIGSEWVERRIAGEPRQPVAEPAVPANTTRMLPSGFIEPAELLLDIDAPAVQVEIPGDYQTTKAANPGLAQEWRLATRQLFEAYFAAGYAVVDFLSTQVDGGRQSSYLLCQGWSDFS